ncbi:hypothetical protein [Mycobacterium sp.]|uniref:hypothetical protein n=1 Tax=Mycobacterium sp. TaxID=1785 RepID=UPI002C2FE4C7|nr:hypothetical protein [Mycobacterium sp.]HKP39604.1 hypothetical protein [Mycobacterium sp.]
MTNTNIARWRRAAAGTGIFLAALTGGTAAAVPASAEPNDGGGFDLNGYLACVAWNNDYVYCCEQNRGFWYPPTAHRSGFCSPIYLPPDASSRPAPGATAKLPPDANTRAGIQ